MDRKLSLLAACAALLAGRRLRHAPLFACIIAMALTEGVLVNSSWPANGPRSPAIPDARVEQALRTLPLYFIENRGQADPRVSYYVQGRSTSLYFTSDGVTFALSGEVPRWSPEVLFDGPARLGTASGRDASGSGWAVKQEFVGANPSILPIGQDLTPAVVSYFKGPRDQWVTGLPTYSTLVYADLWPGIDLVFSGTANRLKSEFLVEPRADPAKIRMAYRAATSVRLNDAGQLEVTTPVGGFEDERPFAYQEVNGRRVEVSAAYALQPDATGHTHMYGFRLGTYDRNQPLVLDPAVLVYAGFIGGSGTDSANGIALDGAGNAYITGGTTSSEATFPVTVGPDLTFNGGPSYLPARSDAYVAKVNAAGTALLYAGYIGGSGSETGRGIAVDRAGNAYVAGITASSEATFPVTVGPDLTYNGGSFDAFVAKVNAEGTALLYAGYIGGSESENGRSVAVDGAGNAYVSGDTDSSEATFPVTVGPDLTFNGGPNDSFVAKVDTAGVALLYAGYIGGSGEEFSRAVAVDRTGNAYIDGSTGSSEATFPVTVGPDLTFNGGLNDAYVAKVNAEGTALLYAGYIGGSEIESGTGIALDGTGNAYISGYTRSSETTFPVTVGPDLTYNGGSFDAFVAKVNAEGTALLYAGYIGGNGDDFGIGVAVDRARNAYVDGSTGSSEATFPVTVGPDLTFNGGLNDAYVAKVNAEGTALLYAGYIGGSGDDPGTGIAVDRAGNAYVVGVTTSSETTFPVKRGPDLTSNGGFDGYVAKIATHRRRERH